MKTLTATPRNVTLLTVTAAVLAAYADCHGSELDTSRGMDTRSLNFRAPSAVSRDEAVAIMSEAVPTGYNEFTATVLKLLPDNARVTIAREGSVCLYVKGNFLLLTRADAYGENADAHPEFKADEISFDPIKMETRIWWD